jgi:hypothetical protein
MYHVYHKMFPEDKTKYPFTNNLKKVPSTSTQVQHSRHRFAPTHTENGQLKISHARMHDLRRFNRSHCKSMYSSLCIIRLSIVYRVILILSNQRYGTVATRTIQLANNLLCYEYPIKRISFAVATLMKMVAPIMATYVGTAPKLTLPKNTSKQLWNRRLTGCCCSRTNKRTHRTETLAEFCAPTSIFTILLDALPYALQQNNVPALAGSPIWLAR